VTARTAILLGVLAAAYVVVLTHFSPLALQDFPNHLARAVVIADLIFHHGREFGSTFSFQFQLAPYILGDLVLAGAVELFGAATAAALWCVLAFLALPAALVLYLRALRVPPDVEFLLLALSLYLATDAFFVLGFLSFRLAVAFILIALALVEGLRREASAALYAVFVLVVITGYLVHMTTIVFLAAAMTVSALVRLRFRTTSLEREALLFLPVALVLAWQFLAAGGYRDSHDVVTELYVWGTPLSKSLNLLWDLRRYRASWDALTGVLLLASLWSARGAFARRALLEPATLELWALAVTFLGIYLVLPYTYAQAAFVDVRALALLPIFAILALAATRDGTGANATVRATTVVLTALLALVNLAYLTRELDKASTWLRPYRALVSLVPRGSTVLPVYTASKEGGIRPLLHVAEFLVIDRTAVSPYLFTGDTGAPMTYFRYRHRPYAPDEEWYTRHLDAVEWHQVAADYGFILVMKPFDFKRISVDPVSISSNVAGSLLTLPRPPAP
jgi:hypothetical protein